MMTATNCIKRAKVQDIRLASTKDDTLQQLCTVITEGWPVTKQELIKSKSNSLFPIQRSAGHTGRRRLPWQSMSYPQDTAYIHPKTNPSGAYRCRRMHSSSKRQRLLSRNDHGHTGLREKVRGVPNVPNKTIQRAAMTSRCSRPPLGKAGNRPDEFQRQELPSNSRLLRQFLWKSIALRTPLVRQSSTS